MLINDPLAGLDDVPWAELRHSYGTADDVPGHLRAMRAGEQEGPYPASSLLANHIVHQGTRSQAAVHTVPFLVRMALDPRVVDRHRIVGLLVAIAIGLDNNHLPNGYDPREDREALESLRGEAEDWAGWIAEAADDGERWQREGSWESALIDAESVVSCYDGVREALPALADEASGGVGEHPATASGQAPGLDLGGVGALRRWNVPTGRAELRAYVGSA